MSASDAGGLHYVDYEGSWPGRISLFKPLDQARFGGCAIDLALHALSRLIPDLQSHLAYLAQYVLLVPVDVLLTKQSNPSNHANGKW